MHTNLIYIYIYIYYIKLYNYIILIDNLFKQIHSRKYNRKYKVSIFDNDNIRITK